MQIQPEGVRVCRATLTRAKARGGAVAARHAKPARLAAATIKTTDPER